MNNFHIKTKRDWCIAAVLTTFVVYAISTRFSFTFQSILLKFGNPMMTNMNQPKSYGNIIFTIIVMMILVEIILIKNKKPKKVIGILAVGTVLVCFGIFQLYLYHVNQIVSVMEEEEGRYISIGYWADDNWIVEDADVKEIFSLCEELKPVAKEEQELLRETLLENEDYIEDTLLLWTQYPEKCGHNFDLMVCVYQDIIFVQKGYDYKQQDIVLFFEDNGLLEVIEKVEEKQ